jgi:o-succinylbenzoate---CoA ligase
MPRGSDLLRPEPSAWGKGISGLLLNPRMPGTARILAAEFPDLPDHLWLATSGTGGKLKLVALSHAALEASARAVNTHLAATSSDLWINALPLFHVGGLGILVRAALAGARWERLAGWDAADFVRQASAHRATLSALVPAQVHDLVSAGLRAPASLRAVVVGGGPLDHSLQTSAESFGWPLLPSYGLTEACSQVATARPGTAPTVWLPLIGEFEARTDDREVLHLSGPSLLTGWMVFQPDGTAQWEDPKTNGWLATADRIELRGRELRVLGRADDLVKIRGELIDLAALERALQARVPSGAIRLDAGPDERNGSILRIVADNAAAAAETRAALDLFPPYARPASVEVGLITRTALGKIVRPAGGSDG